MNKIALRCFCVYSEITDTVTFIPSFLGGKKYFSEMNSCN